MDTNLLVRNYPANQDRHPGLLHALEMDWEKDLRCFVDLYTLSRAECSSTPNLMTRIENRL